VIVAFGVAPLSFDPKLAAVQLGPSHGQGGKRGRSGH
jgi:hypothetical protein